MDVEAARRALGELSGSHAIEAVPGGWSFWVFRVGSDRVARFPKHDRAARGLEREVALLPALAEKVSFQVPAPLAVGRFGGRPFALARWQAGRDLAARDVAADAAPTGERAAAGRARISRALAELHGFPRKQAAELLIEQADPGAWRARYAALRETLGERVAPLLAAPLRDRVAEGYARFLDDSLGGFAHPVLVHGDLGVSHLRVDDAGGLAGMLDFESAAIGDPAIDFVGLQIAFGHEVVRDVLARYGGVPDPGFAERLHFYVWMGAMHAILHGLDHGDDALVADAIRNLAKRIEG